MARMKKDGTPAKKPGRKPANTETTKELSAVQLTGPVRIETPEEKKLMEIDVPKTPKVVNKPGRPATCDGFTVRALEGEFGRYFRDQIGEKDYIDYTSIGGEEISMTVESWAKFVAELDRAFSALGVKL